VLPVAQITLTWLLALAHERTGSKAPLIAGVVLNLASLGTFKYLDFAMQSIEGRGSEDGSYVIRVRGNEAVAR
jgi:hypothetical protein